MCERKRSRRDLFTKTNTADCAQIPDLSSLSLASLRSRLAIIPQDPVLFNETIK